MCNSILLVAWVEQRHLTTIALTELHVQSRTRPQLSLHSPHNSTEANCTPLNSLLFTFFEVIHSLYCRT